MCWLEKCCYFVPLDYVCLLIGVFTGTLSLFTATYSTVLLILENASPKKGADHLLRMIHLDLTSSVKIILSIILIMAILWMLFSIMLVVGIRKNRSNFVLCYFSFGILVAIMLLLGSLLVLLERHWIIALIEVIAALFYIHCLTAVHSAYELMQRGKVFGLNQHRQLDEDGLITPTQ